LSSDEPDVVKKLDADKEILAESGYWRANERVLRGKSEFVKRAWALYLDEPDPVRKAALIKRYDHRSAKSGNIIRDLIGERDFIRLAIRSGNPEVTAILLRHGYGIAKPKDWEGPIPWLEYEAKTQSTEEWEEAYVWPSVPVPELTGN